MMWLADRKLFERFQARIDSYDPAAMPIAAKLRENAQRLCEQSIPAVTDKRPTPQSPSSDPHDYVSVGTYWWPNPDTADGLPYVKRDGLLSPDFALYDRPRWDAAADAMVQTMRAAFLLRDRAFAHNAVQRLRTWFLNPDTRMNPHLNHAQFIPGRHAGGPPGIIDFALYLPVVLDHIELLNSFSPSPWTAQDQEGLVTWCRALTTWLETSPLALREQQAENNHGTYYDRFLITLRLFTGTRTAATELAGRVRDRVIHQIEPDGRAPRELKRTCSFGYSLMNAQGLLDIAYIARRLGDDLWNWSAPNGGSIPAAVRFMFDYACSRDEWPFEQIEPIDWRMVALMAQKANSMDPSHFDVAEMAHRLPANFDPIAFSVVAPLHPFGAERAPATARG